MSDASSPLTYKEAEATVVKAASKAIERDFEASFQLYVKAAKAFLHLSRTVASSSSLSAKDTAALKARFREKAAAAMERAEQVKVTLRSALATEKVTSSSRSSSRYSEEEQRAVLDHSSRLHGIRIPLFTSPVSLLERGDVYEDPDGQPPLSEDHTLLNAQWKRPVDLWPNKTFQMSRNSLLSTGICQRLVTDCSVIAAMALCWEHHSRFRSHLCLSSIYPQDQSGQPYINQAGRYIVGLYLNGDRRQVCRLIATAKLGLILELGIDDRLPADGDGSLLCARTNDNDLWPALVEKAYMKIHGGYSFPGSDTATDLDVLIGWIPEAVDLKSADFQIEKTLRSLARGFHSGDCLFSLGTGRTVSRLVDGPAWLPCHSYAVIDICETTEAFKLKLIVDNLDHSGPFALSDSRSNYAESSPTDDPFAWITSHELRRTFDSLHISWNPSVFASREIVHGLWRMQQGVRRSTHHHRLVLPEGRSRNTSKDDEMWVLLVRHTSDKDQSIEFMSLHVTETSSRAHAEDIVAAASLMTNSFHILARTRINSGETSLSITVTLDLGSQDPLPGTFGYTLRTFSQRKAYFVEDQKMGFTQVIDAAFTSSSAGGSSLHRTFMDNPQYEFSFVKLTAGSGPSRTGVIRVVVECVRTVPVNVKLVRGNGNRIVELRKGDVHLDSGPYSYGCAVLEGSIPPGHYSLIFSTFEPGVRIAYSVQLESSMPFSLKPIPAEGDGTFSRTITGSWQNEEAAGSPAFGRYHNNPSFEIIVHQQTSLFGRLQIINKPGGVPINLTIFRKGNGIEQLRQIGSSGDYSDAVCGVGIAPQQVDGPAVYVAIVSTFSPQAGIDFELRLYSTRSPVEVVSLSSSRDGL